MLFFVLLSKYICLIFFKFQVGDESFLVVVNDILASGEVPNLIPDDDVEDVILALGPVVKSLGLEESRENCWKLFIERVRKQLKVYKFIKLKKA